VTELSHQTTGQGFEQEKLSLRRCPDFLRVTAVYTGSYILLRARISYGNSVRLSLRLSRPGTDSRPCETETPGLHHVIA